VGTGEGPEKDHGEAYQGRPTAHRKTAGTEGKSADAVPSDRSYHFNTLKYFILYRKEEKGEIGREYSGIIPKLCAAYRGKD